MARQNFIEGHRVRVICARCSEPFVFLKKTKAKIYCDPCKRQNRIESCERSSRLSYATKVKPRRIAAGDLINISVRGEPDLTTTLSVPADGRISFPLVDALRAAGLTPDELEILLTQKLRRYISDPQVSVKEIYVIETLPDVWPVG